MEKNTETSQDLKKIIVGNFFEVNFQTGMKL